MKHEISLYLYVLPQNRAAIRLWKSLGYDRINMLELVKDLIPTRRGSRTRPVALLGERFEIFRWKREESSPEELEFMDLLRLFNEALRLKLKG